MTAQIVIGLVGHSDRHEEGEGEDSGVLAGGGPTGDHLDNSNEKELFREEVIDIISGGGDAVGGRCCTRGYDGNAPGLGYGGGHGGAEGDGAGELLGETTAQAKPKRKVEVDVGLGVHGEGIEAGWVVKKDRVCVGVGVGVVPVHCPDRRQHGLDLGQGGETVRRPPDPALRVDEEDVAQVLIVHAKRLAQPLDVLVKEDVVGLGMV
ncbi:hypothetical protein BC936DRAFT_145712 [Jimgerdemannia flammicorona]|uniref:Uncharacterized protein n=1 Tax=Jimgerdemannia flammicorona TaxID=994334 RepID=A0A433D9C7_9FUNG|nr:hypothetical protein BC936DRAFT_145712 [Jimgerdemannia flammicorona]